jgi:hypothetical protein
VACEVRFAAGQLLTLITAIPPVGAAASTRAEQAIAKPS